MTGPGVRKYPRYNCSVTYQRLRQLLCGNADRFTLPTQLVKDRLGSPVEIRILHKWCERSGRDVVLMTFSTDEGLVEVFCPIGFINGEETVIDGWIGAEINQGSGDNAPIPPPRGIDDLRTLFDGDKNPRSADVSGEPQIWKRADQATFGDLLDDRSA